MWLRARMDAWPLSSRFTWAGFILVVVAPMSLSHWFPWFTSQAVMVTIACLACAMLAIDALHYAVFRATAPQNRISHVLFAGSMLCGGTYFIADPSLHWTLSIAGIVLFGAAMTVRSRYFWREEPEA